MSDALGIDRPDILQEARRRGAKLHKIGIEYVGPCPRCGGHDRFAINPKEQIFICRQGRAGGDVFDLVKYLDGVDYRTAVETLLGKQLDSRSISNVPDGTFNVDRIEFGLRMWGESGPLTDTRGEFYFTKHRQLQIRDLGDLSHALRWHGERSCVVALMTDAITNEPTGIHRTFLHPDGSKRERKMLGRQGVVRLSPDDAVTQGLGLVEGVEDGLAVLLSGWAPTWCATSAGAIERFPVLGGIGALTIFADADGPGMAAASDCAPCWIAAGREARISPPPGVSRHV